MNQLTQPDSIMEKLTVLSDAAKYDVACTSSGVQRGGDGHSMGNARASGVCHAFTGDGRCISLLKILLTNECIYNCRYCINRSSNDVKRATFTPEEVCRLTVEFYRRNYIEGLFLSSGIIHSPDHTMALLYETLLLLRGKYRFHGYVHIKGIPGASGELVEQVGYLADRMSVNLELPTGEGLRTLAPNKVRRNILSPMRQIQNGIRESRQNHGISSMKSRMYLDEKSYYEQMAELKDSAERLADYHRGVAALGQKNAQRTAEESWGFMAYGGGKASAGGTLTPVSQTARGLQRPDRYFVPAGQSTQMIIGATSETDYQILSVTEALYERFDMKRVFYSAFVNVNRDETLPAPAGGPPLLREHRLYQADFLLRFYGFKADELLSEIHPNFNAQIDPKCDWAVHHLEEFPVEINRADYYTLLRVPGIGTKSAKRILMARRHAVLGFEDIKKLGVVLKRALYFITCKGRMLYPTKLEEGYITRHLIYNERPGHLLLSDGTEQTYEQLSLFEAGL
ncbi:MAG: putative DNA modification/repair radical SAM protein [Muribaculaceae bacterium]|nr:putative DNA modification/repair radical SAM protein [Roseburia sp.]MCM1431857.1 putative DNA modification/repair radical SAM protein [Muribaculaceae bacterium]MCM1493417.1 putative DNA modification/repair radical SAM protein [Muribaculaceae bacterium]